MTNKKKISKRAPTEPQSPNRKRKMPMTIRATARMVVKESSPRPLILSSESVPT